MPATQRIPQHYEAEVEITRLHENPENPNRGDTVAIGESMDEHGFYGAIYAQAGTGTIIVGNHRYRVAVARGEDTVPVIWMDCDVDTAERVLMVDNYTARLAANDPEAERALLERLAASERGLAGTGYTDDDLRRLISEANYGQGPGDGPSLAQRFVVPPFTVLDARGGPWVARKQEWLQLGLRSEVGRDGELAYNLSIDRSQAGTGTSVFDPVLCEIAYRWFSRPDGTVLDPFAGGSVRGIVAAALGRSYTGIELRPEQVAENQQQAAGIVPGLEVSAPLVDYTPTVTPVEQRGSVWVKRDDTWTRGGAQGAKARVMFALAEARSAEGIITAGARNSPQIERAALVAASLGIGCRVHVPAGADTPEIATCLQAGAEVVRHQAGRLSVLRARFRDDTAAYPDWLAVPFGMGLDEYVDDVAAQVRDLPDDVDRIVVPCGSGATLAGVVRGLRKLGSSLRVVGVTLGHDPSEYLDRFEPDWRNYVTLVASEGDFEDPAPTTVLEGLRLDSRYEAKCLPHLQAGDLLWCVGIRSSEAAGPTLEAPPPRWVEGDSAQVLADPDPYRVGADYDLVFSCPPYADLEKYSDLPGELSAMEYDVFLAAYRDIIRLAVDRLAPNRFAVWVVGEVRDPTGAYRNFVGDTVQAFQDAGAAFYNEAILVTPAGSLPLRAARYFNASRKLGKCHQQVLVFVKGDARAATEACGPVEVPATDDDTDDEGEVVTDGG